MIRIATANLWDWVVSRARVDEHLYPRIIPQCDGDSGATSSKPTGDEPWPDNPDEIPAWRIAQELRAEAGGYKLPAYRTRREFERCVALCEGVTQCAPPPPTPIGKPLPANDAARHFLDWMRLNGITGQISSERLSGLYADFCAQGNTAPAAENMVRGSLKRLSGVTVSLADKRRPGGVRTRPTIWNIASEAGVPAARAA